MQDQKKVMRAQRGRGWVPAPGTAALTPGETPRPRPLRVLSEERPREGPASQGQHSHQNLKVPASSSGFLASRNNPLLSHSVTGILLGQPQLAHTPPYPRPMQLVFCPCEFLPGVRFCLGAEIRRVSLGDIVGPVLLSFLHI